jgi:hypothetical protein
METAFARKMKMNMVVTTIAEGRWSFRDDVPCANRRRQSDFGVPLICRLYFANFFLVEIYATSNGAGGIGASLVLSHYKIDVLVLCASPNDMDIA